MGASLLISLSRELSMSVNDSSSRNELARDGFLLSSMFSLLGGMKTESLEKIRFFLVHSCDIRVCVAGRSLLWKVWRDIERWRSRRDEKMTTTVFDLLEYDWGTSSFVVSWLANCCSCKHSWAFLRFCWILKSDVTQLHFWSERNIRIRKFWCRIMTGIWDKCMWFSVH